MRVRKLSALCTLLLAGGCYDVAGWAGNTPSMDPGQDCLQCHSASGVASERTWTLAGTVFPGPDAQIDAGVVDAEVLVTDSAGAKLTLLTNVAGNFYTAETLQPPLHVEVQWGGTRMRMVESPPIGSCNACHLSPTPQVAPVKGFSPAPGRVFVPTGKATP